MGKLYKIFGIFSESSDHLSHLVLNQPKAGIAQKLDEFGVKFVICVPGTSSEFHGGIEMGKHVDFAGWVLGGTDGLAGRLEVAGT